MELDDALRAAISPVRPLAHQGRRRLPVPARPGPRSRPGRPAARRTHAQIRPLRRSPGTQPRAGARRRARQPPGDVLVPRRTRHRGAARGPRRRRSRPRPLRVRRAVPPPRTRPRTLGAGRRTGGPHRHHPARPAADRHPPARFDSAYDKALAFTRQALDLVDPAEDPRTAAHLWTLRAGLLRNSSRSSGLAELQKAEALLVDLPPSIEHARVLGQIARDEMLEKPTEKSVATAREALAIAQRIGSPADEAAILKTLGCLLVNLSHVEEGLAQFDEALAIAKRASEPDIMCLVLSNQASVLEGLGRHVEAADAARESARIARERGLMRGIGAFTIGNLAESLISLGQWDEADRLLDESFEYDPKAQTKAHMHQLVVQIALARGDIARATHCLDKAREMAASKWYIEPQFRLPLRTLEVAVARRLGRLTDVREILATELGTPPPAGHQRYVWPLLVEAARAEGDVTELGGLPARGRGAESPPGSPHLDPHVPRWRWPGTARWTPRTRSTCAPNSPVRKARRRSRCGRTPSPDGRRRPSPTCSPGSAAAWPSCSSRPATGAAPPRCCPPPTTPRSPSAPARWPRKPNSSPAAPASRSTAPLSPACAQPTPPTPSWPTARSSPRANATSCGSWWTAAATGRSLRSSSSA
ncbi:tetratricopeptide repeat protein [Yinghuangia aomiensis]